MFADRIKKEQKVALTITRAEIEVAVCEFLAKNSDEIALSDDFHFSFEMDYEGHLVGAEMEITSTESV